MMNRGGMKRREWGERCDMILGALRAAGAATAAPRFNPPQIPPKTPPSSTRAWKSSDSAVNLPEPTERALNVAAVTRHSSGGRKTAKSTRYTGRVPISQ